MTDDDLDSSASRRASRLEREKREARETDKRRARHAHNLRQAALVRQHPEAEAVDCRDPAPQRPLYRPISAAEDADLTMIGRLLERERAVEAEGERINAAVKDKWLSLSRPEPKSIHSPAPPALTRFEGPKQPVRGLSGVRNPDRIVGCRSREFTIGRNLIGGRIISR
jgi:hypothetical protein